MDMNENILEVKNLAYSFHTYVGEVQAVRGVDFCLQRGKTLGIVGESGCGKSVTAKSIMRLNPEKPMGEIKHGEIWFDGEDITKLGTRQMEKLRGSDMRMIFQDPMTSLNPTMTIGKQIIEGIMKSGKTTKAQAKERALETLKLAGIPSPQDRLKQYPHEFSGGMRQRVMIALAMSVNPKLLIADEPTTALDVTTQAQILTLIRDIQREYDTAIILITHDLGVVANIADSIAVMYGGKIMEYGISDDIFELAAHPYTWGVMKSIPPIDGAKRELLKPIPGTPPDLFAPPKGCPFAARCPYTMEVCNSVYPDTFEIGPGHTACCWLYHELADTVTNPITGKEAKA